MSQIGLPFEWQGQGPAQDFLVSEANAIAVAHLERWRDWPVSVAALTGPPLSGRSTLARQFARMSGGVVIDDAQGQDERLLFNAWNEAQTARRPLLLVGDTPPSQWTVALPDLKSRLAAMPHVAITEPDEPLARALIERFLTVSGTPYATELPDWLLRRIERRYGTIAAVVRLLDRTALSSGRKISVALAKETLQSAGFLPIVQVTPSP
ncbi:MAG: chromosomal replication initiator DnaA [bacterium]|nr:chromosomal replication initiator DnaA [bacterium]